MKKGLFIIIALFLCNVGQSQSLDEEIGFKLVKAEYLLNTERFEDAIRELNDIVKTNPSYKNTLLLRAETKYKLAAFKGAKSDAMEAINLFGITPKAAAILGKSEYALNNSDQAFNSISAAIALGEKDTKLYEIRAEIYEIRGQKQNACEDWQTAGKMGSQKGQINAKRVCNGLDQNASHQPNNNSTSNTNTSLPPANNEVSKIEEPINTNNTPTTNEDININNQTSKPEGIDTTASSVESTTEDPTIPKEDDTISDVVIDEELTLQIFGMGLGKRKLMEKPNILILSERDGIVAVEICVNAEGKVEAAEFVGTKSTISQASLVSLAIRKAKEIWFEPSQYTKQCGFVNFVIKGS